MISRILFFLLLVSQSLAATYYVDFTGGSDANAGTSKGSPLKRHPWMTTYSGAVALAAGDTVKMKGGETWTSACYPIIVGQSGSAGNLITTTTDHTWFTGGAFSQPTLNAQSTNTSGGMIQAVGKSYFTFDDLNIINYGTTLSGVGVNCIVFDSCQQLTVSNCTAAPECQRWIYINSNTSPGVTYTGFNFVGNDVSHMASFCWFTSGGANTTTTSINFWDNKIHDAKSQIVDGVHADGIVHFFNSTGHPVLSETMTNIDISGNQVYGDWSQGNTVSSPGVSAFIVNDASLGNTQIYNNRFCISPFTDGQISDWMYFGPGTGTNSTTQFYNNTIDATGSNNGNMISTGSGDSGCALIIKNNIFYGGKFISIDNTAGGTLTMNNNLWTTPSGSLFYNGAFKTYAQWIALGFDTAPVSSVLGSDPLFVTSHIDQHLQSSSPARSVAANLTALGITRLNSDLSGVARPGGATLWDVGAYQFNSGSVQAVPTNYRKPRTLAGGF